MNGTGNLGGVTVSGTTCELLAWLPWLASGLAAWKLGLGQFLEIERPPPSDALPVCKLQSVSRAELITEQRIS